MQTGRKTEEKIFKAVIQLTTSAEREAYTLEACGDNHELLTGVRTLLKHHDADSFLDTPVFQPDVTLDDSPIAEGPGTVIDKYKLLEQIGEGGMAVVYMAEQEEPIRRKVALKIIKLGMDTKSVIARFEAERQALALMDHPNIAKVLDAGATETGRPYFVMELVTGVSITEYCDKNNLSTKQRLPLFIQVCNAVQHAHQKGIIHRDIKPTNVMVTQHEGSPVPKVIDFGIAKATKQRLTEKTLFTRYAHIIGTPAYMSPEQADMSDLDVDTRSDIYSLGVLLYELLTGATPFSEEELRKAGCLEMQRVIREQEPSRPSTKLSTLGETLTDIAKYRASTPHLLAKSIRGDLDWIVMKTLEKARERRYDNASALVLDVQRHLDNKPILARAPSTIYRLRKFLWRHRSQTIAAASIVVLAGALIAVLSMWNLNRRQLAKAESLKAEADFLKDEKILSQARECFARRDLTAALTTLESILNSEHVGPEARLLCANIYLYRAEHYHHLGDEDNVVADMERYVNILDPLEATDQGNRRLKDMLIGLWRGTPENLGPIVNSSENDRAPSISADGSTIYFASRYRPGGHGDMDLWQVSIEPVVDLNGDGIVDSADVRTMIDHWGTDEPLCDIGPMPWGDGIVDVQDLIVLSEHLFEEVNDPALVAHWALDETEGSIAHDNVSGSDDIVMGGAFWQPTGGKIDGALELDGVDDCVITTFGLNPAEGPFSVLAWVKGGAPGQVIVSEPIGSNWLMVDTEGKLMTELAGSDRTPLVSQTVITDGGWHRIGFVWDGSNRTLCVDEDVAAEDSQSDLEASGGGLYIGVDKNYAAGTFFSGLIDDIRIYNRVVRP